MTAHLDATRPGAKHNDKKMELLLSKYLEKKRTDRVVVDLRWAIHPTSKR